MKKLYVLIYVILFFSCKNSRYDNYIKIENSTEINIEATSISMNRGVIVLNDKYYLFSACPLIYEESYPEWIFSRIEPLYTLDNYVYHPKIGDVSVPFKLVKESGSDYLTIIKHNESLKFKLIYEF